MITHPHHPRTPRIGAAIIAFLIILLGLTYACAADDPAPAAPPTTQPASTDPEAEPTPPAPATQPSRPLRRGMGGMGRGGMGRGAGGGGVNDMSRHGPVIHSLFDAHTRITRTIEDIPDGVRTVTTSDDPAATTLIRRHVRQMEQRLKDNRPIRMMDPLFVEIFRHTDAIQMEFKDIPGGIEVTEHSTNPQVVLLIRQHARAVSEFVAQGWDRMPQPTPLPEGYTAAPDE